MSRILKRPMFRKGGEVMEGIMTGIKPRQNYALGERVEEYQNVLRSSMGQPVGGDPLARFLIETGQGLVGGAGADRGSKLAEILGATEKPTQNLFAALDKKAASDRSVNLQGAILGIKGQQAIDIAKAKSKDKFLKDLSPDRYYKKLVDERTSAGGKLKSFEIPTIDLKFPRKTAEFDAYVLPQLRKTKDPKGQQILSRLDGFVPYSKKEGTFDYGSMKAGLIYYDLLQKVFIERVPASEDEEGGYFTYNPNNYERTKLRGLES
jgi:hypothetical protein